MLSFTSHCKIHIFHTTYTVTVRSGFILFFLELWKAHDNYGPTFSESYIYPCWKADSITLCQKCSLNVEGKMGKKKQEKEKLDLLEIIQVQKALDINDFMSLVQQL